MEIKKHYITYVLDEAGLILTASSIYDNKAKFEAQHRYMEKEFKERASEVTKVEYDNYYQAKIDKTLRTLASDIAKGIESKQITQEDMVIIGEKIAESMHKINNANDDKW